MGRRRTKLQLTELQKAELARQLKGPGDPRTRERLKFAEWATTGRFTLEELATRIGRSRSTIQNWLVKFEAGGLAALLERDTPPGQQSPLAQAKLQAQLKSGLRSGRLKTAAQVSIWLEEKHGCKRARKSIYYWLDRFKDESRS